MKREKIIEIINNLPRVLVDVRMHPFDKHDYQQAILVGDLFWAFPEEVTKEFEKFTQEQEEILEDTTCMEEKLEQLEMLQLRD